MWTYSVAIVPIVGALTQTVVVGMMIRLIRLEGAKETLEKTKGGCGSGTIACRLWNSLNRLVREVEHNLIKKGKHE